MRYVKQQNPMTTHLPRPLKPRSLHNLKLPRAVEEDSRHAEIVAVLKKDERPLWGQSTLAVPHIPLIASFETCLKELLHRRQLERGLEHIDKLLSNEQKGLSAIQEKKGTPASRRVSRLLIIAHDGSERFYRDCEKTLLRNSERLLLLHVNEPSSRLAEGLLGLPDKPLKALLVSDRDAVSLVLFSLIGPLL